MNSKSLNITPEKLVQLRALLPEAFSEDKADFAGLEFTSRRSLFFTGITFITFLSFEIFNFASTSFALRDILGNFSIGPFLWSTILALAFCGIDFAGVAHAFTPVGASDKATEVFYLFGAWFLAAAFNAWLTWWGVTVVIANQTTDGAGLLSSSMAIKVVPILVAIIVLAIRILLIFTFSAAGGRLLRTQEVETAMKSLGGDISASDAKLTEPTKSLKGGTEEDVSFTAYHPREGKVDTWYTLRVYTHLLTVINDVRQDAQRFGDRAFELREVTSALTRLTRGTEITIIPACDGITFNPSKISFNWMEDFHRADFRFFAANSLENDAAKGHIRVLC